MQVKFRLLAAAALLAVGLTACGSGNAQTSSTPAANQQAAATKKPAHGHKKKKEEPLTGDVKQKAEQAALAKYPGTVTKSEHDAEKPGMYAVEIKQASGQSVEVYLDKSYQVTGTKNEDQGKAGQGDGNGG
ncbi:hypothetical protein [Lentzea sp. NPDC004782]|uniref:PepSY domain-containing protein n=1 Tax=Lentzea sp. NPDC004782 TaxID=3154458 RepID=UPI0033A5B936